MTYIHPDSHLDTDTKFGQVKECPKCGRIAKFRTVCTTCIEKIKATHAPFESEWDIYPEDAEVLNRSEVMKLHSRGCSFQAIANSMGINQNTVRWVVHCNQNGISNDLIPEPPTRRGLKLISKRRKASCEAISLQSNTHTQ